MTNILPGEVDARAKGQRRKALLMVAVGVIGLGITVLGYVVGVVAGGEPLLGWIGCPLLLVPIVGVPLGLAFWPFMGHLLWLASMGERVGRWLFPLLLLSQYLALVLLLDWDLKRPRLQRDLDTIWNMAPSGLIIFAVSYAIAHAFLWSLYAFCARSVPAASRKDG